MGTFNKILYSAVEGVKLEKYAVFEYVVDSLRSMGYNYDETAKVFADHGMDKDAFEDAMWRLDEMEASEG